MMPNRFIWYILDLSHGNILSTWEGTSTDETPEHALRAFESAKASRSIIALAVGRRFHQPDNTAAG